MHGLVGRGDVSYIASLGALGATKIHSRKTLETMEKELKNLKKIMFFFVKIFHFNQPVLLSLLHLLHRLLQAAKRFNKGLDTSTNGTTDPKAILFQL